MTQLMTGPFNAMNYDPELGVPQLPLGLKQPARLVSDEVVGAKGNASNGFIAFEVEIIDGANKGAKGVYRLNIYNQSERAVEIAYRQLSALSIACQTPHWQDTRELYNKPFLIDVTPQKATEQNEGKGYTEISAVYDVNGNRPTRQGATGQTQQNNQQQNNGQQQGNGQVAWNNNGGGQQNNGQATDQGQQQNNNGQQGNWNNGQQGNQQGNQQQADQNQQQNNGQQNAGNWNNTGGGQQQNNGQQNGGGTTPPWMQK